MRLRIAQTLTALAHAISADFGADYCRREFDRVTAVLCANYAEGIRPTPEEAENAAKALDYFAGEYAAAMGHRMPLTAAEADRLALVDWLLS